MPAGAAAPAKLGLGCASYGVLHQQLPTTGRVQSTRQTAYLLNSLSAGQTNFILSWTAGLVKDDRS